MSPVLAEALGRVRARTMAPAPASQSEKLRACAFDLDDPADPGVCYRCGHPLPHLPADNVTSRNPVGC